MKDVLGNDSRIKPQKYIPVVEIYDGQIADMRTEGHTLQEIGNEIGVTRERVRQILEQHYGGVNRGLMPETKVAEIIGCLQGHLCNLRERGIIAPKHWGFLWLYDRDEIEKAMLALQRFCKHCGEPIPFNSGLTKYCPECSKEYKRYPYPFKSDEAKRKSNIASTNWRKRHPGRTGEIQKKANRKYWKKHKREHYAKTQYVVVHGNILPIGSIFKIVGGRRGCLLLENGLEIPTRHIRKVVVKGG